MDAEIVTIGTELLLGQIVDTNSAYLSKALNELGINVYYQSSVGDNKKRLGEVLSTACKRSELVVTSGGLGPTDDDITLEVIAEVLDKEMECHQKALDHLKQFYHKIKRIYSFPKKTGLLSQWIQADTQSGWNCFGYDPGR